MAGLGDLTRMMKDARQLQQKLLDRQAEIAQMEVTATSGGGMVTVVASGDQQIKSIVIEREVINPEDAEMLQDLVLAAVNEALAKSRDLVKQELAGLTGGLNIPGLF